MKILHINSYYKVGRFYKNLYNNQVKSGLNIDVFVPVTLSYEDDNFDYGSYTTKSPNHFKFDRYIFHLKHRKILNDIQHKYNINKYSIIHAHSLFSNGYIAMKLKLKYGIPYIVAVRNTDVNVFFKKMVHLRKLGINILKEASRVIFLSGTYRENTIDKYVPKHLQELVYKKSLIIPNGIDDFWLKNVSPYLKQKPGYVKIRLLQVGEINRNKNIQTTVKAVEILINKGYRVQLDIVGEIKDKIIFNRIKSLDYVNYLGYKPKEGLIHIYRENDIFVLPSITETFGLVYPEAMTQGLPVIYTRGQGFDNQFQDGEVGFAVDCFDANDIAENIIKITDNYEEISNNCINQCNKFDWSTIEKQYNNIYINSLAGNL